MQGVDEWRLEPVREREGGEARVVVHHIERIARRGRRLDLVEAVRRVVRLEDRDLDRIGVGALEHRLHHRRRLRAGGGEQGHGRPRLTSSAASSSPTCLIPP